MSRRSTLAVKVRCPCPAREEYSEKWAAAMKPKIAANSVGPTVEQPRPLSNTDRHRSKKRKAHHLSPWA
jgi:hypothetical protein